jgi:hypothetical protein
MTGNERFDFLVRDNFTWNFPVPFFSRPGIEEQDSLPQHLTILNRRVCRIILEVCRRAKNWRADKLAILHMYN